MRYLFFFLSLLSITGRSFAQTDGFNSLLSAFDAYRTRGVQEKVFVHTDKPDYLAGEIIWFKIYCVDASTHTPLDLSKVCYVDVLDKDDRFVLQGKIGLKEGEGRGSFYLPLTLNSGNYKLRAYTNWMKNFGPGHFFEQPVTIINTLKELQVQGPPADSVAAVTALTGSSTGSANGGTIVFFPEGGNLVQGISSIIAFRATDGEGKGVDCKGDVFNENNDTIGSFASLRFGIGRFSFTPGAGHSYKAMIRLADGDSIVKELPVAYDKGYTLHIDDGSDAGGAGDPGNAQIKVTVRARGPVSQGVTLFGRSGQSFRLALRGMLAQDSAEFTIPWDSLGEGITQLTLFNGEYQPECERLVFRRPADRMSIDVIPDKSQYGTRRKINLALSASDLQTKGGVAPSSLSLSVYRLDSLSTLPDMDMMNYLWMSSDLKGRIDSAGYYFTARGPEADQALDNLMLTHGWRRFRWEEHIRETPPAFAYPPEYSGHIISGKLTDMRTGAPLIHRIASLSTPGIDYRFRSAVADSAGKIVFDLNEFYGQEGIVIGSGGVADSPAKVDIFSPFSEQYGGERLSSFRLSDAVRQSLQDRSLNMQVQNIYAADSLQRFRPPSQDTLHFFSYPGRTYMLDDYTRFTTMEEVLREYVQEVNVNRPHGKLHLLMLDDPERQFFDDDNTLVLLDGVPVPDDKIFFYDPLKVKKLEIVPRRYFLGPAFYSGVASFTTYKGDYEGLELDRHCTLLDYEGLQWQREFYSPLYETPQQKAGRLPDFRNLLFWSSDIHLQGQEKKQYSFYSSDLPGTYLIVVQGLTADGHIGYRDVRFDVK